MFSRILLAIAAVCVVCLTFAGDHAIARSIGNQSGAHAPTWTGGARHHHFHNRFAYPYRRTIIYGSGYNQPGYAPVEEEVAPRPVERAVVEKRRECEPKTYTVPNASGGESQVTVIRC